MRFYRRLYTTKRIKDPASSRRHLIHGIGEPDLYVLLLDETGKHLSFMHNAFLLQPYYHEDGRADIVGLARGKQDMEELLASLIEETVKKTGKTDVCSFLFSGDRNHMFGREHRTGRLQRHSLLRNLFRKRMTL